MKKITLILLCLMHCVLCIQLNAQVITSVMDAPYTSISHNGVYSYGNYEDIAFYYNAETGFKLALQGDNLDDGGCWVWDVNDLGQLAVEHKKRAALWTEANGYEYLPMPEGYNENTYRFETGTPPIAEAIGLGKALEFIAEIGLENIEKAYTECENYDLDITDFNFFSNSF